MRKATLALAAAALLALGVGPAVGAPPAGHFEQVEAVCNGTPVTATVTNGASFWIGETHYVVVSFTGTFTPVEGEPETFTQTFGQKRGLRDRITCTGSETEPGVGTFSFEVTAAAVPGR